MITTIAKEVTFEAAHCVPTFPEHHKCHRMHGHSYRVELRFTGPTLASGLCAGIDYADIAAVWARVNEKVDHRVLNEVPGLEVPTTENLVAWIWTEFVRACGVEHARLAQHFTGIRVSEGSSTWCELRFTDGEGRVIA